MTDKTARKNDNLYRALVENLPDAMVILNEKLKILALNKHAAALYGFSSTSEMVGRPLPELISADDKLRAMVELERVLATGKVCLLRYALVKAQGVEFQAELSVSTVPGLGGASAGLLAIVRDVSHRETGEPKDDRLIGTLLGTAEAISALIKYQDPFIADHQERVARLAGVIAEEMGLSGAQVDCIRLAGIIHDLGKLQVPAQILSKPGKLTGEEFAVIKKHVVGGHDIVSPIDLPLEAATAILQHHERLNGSGYPRGVTDRELLLEARILAVADVVEAMASRRPYRAGLGLAAALDEVAKNSGTLFDPDVVRACLRLYQNKKLSFLGA